jgi:hypothetical protein
VTRTSRLLAKDGKLQRRMRRLRGQRRSLSRAVTIGVCAAIALLGAPAAASAASITDLGEGFPVSMNASDHILLAKLGEEDGEETLEAPWSIWSGGKSVHLEPINGEPAPGETQSLDHEHELDLDNINEAGQVGGSSSVVNEETPTTTLSRAVSTTATGEVHEVPLLEEEIEKENSKGERVSRRVGSLGTGIDNAGDIVGIGVEGIEVEGKPKAFARGFFDKGGTASPPEVVGDADKPATGQWDSEVFEVNGAGTMLGDVIDVNEKDEQEKPTYYLWKSPSEAGTALNFDTPVRGLASDGSVLGERAGTVYLREPGGKETAISKLEKPVAVNASHQVVGSEMVSGAEHAAVWQAGTVTDLNTLLPAGSGWVLQRATAITNTGDIAGIGTHEGKAAAFLFQPGLVVTSAKDSKESTSAGAGVCVSEEGGCTLRAAIETANASTDSTPVLIAFHIEGIAKAAVAQISPQSPLPEIKVPVKLDASTQPEAVGSEIEGFGADEVSGLQIGAELDGANAGSSPGLSLAAGAAGSVIEGLQIQNFQGDGVLLSGPNEQLAASVLYHDKVGVEVAASNDIVGAGNGLLGDIFLANGNTEGLLQYLQKAGKDVALSAYDTEVLSFGAGVLLSKSSSGTLISGDEIGAHDGFAFSGRDKLPEQGFSNLGLSGSLTQTQPSGVLIDPESGQTITGVTIGGSSPATGDVISSNGNGVAILDDGGGTVSGVSVLGSAIGPEPSSFGRMSEPAKVSERWIGELGDVIGLIAEGPVSGLRVGAPGEGDLFQHDAAGVILEGEKLIAPQVQADTFGTDHSLSDFVGDHGEPVLGLHDILGLIAADTHGAQIGGADRAGNLVSGDPIGVVLAGEHSLDNVIQGNTIGLNTPSTSGTLEDVSEFGALFGILAVGPELGKASGSQNQQVIENKLQGSVFGMLSAQTTGMRVQGNTVQENLYGVFDVGSGATQIGGSVNGQGNSFLNNGAGLFLANQDPTEQELKDAKINQEAVSESTRKSYLSEPSEGTVFDDVDATTTADLSSASAQTPAAPGTQNTIMGNLMGVDSAGQAQPNTVATVIAGDEHGVSIGGTVPGQGNTIEDNRNGGVWLVGTAGHPPTAQILGNTIYNNENFTGPALGVPGLGIDLARLAGTAATPFELTGGFGLGVNPQDPTQPDAGPNNLQNSPILSPATTAGGQLMITGSLHGVASTNYLIEVFADENQNPFGAGEGQTLLGRINLSTDAAGNVSFSANFAAPAGGYRYVSSTATTVPASGPGVTSEFSVNAPITTSGVTPSPGGSAGAPAPTTPVTVGSTPKGAPTTTVSADGTSVSTSGASVTLPIQASCSSATASPCTVTTSATVPAATAAKASVTASVANAKHNRGERPVKIGSGTMKLASGASGALHIKLTSHGLALLRSHGSLAITVTVTISGHGRAAVTRTLHLKLKFKKQGAAHGKR